MPSHSWKQFVKNQCHQTLIGNVCTYSTCQHSIPMLAFRDKHLGGHAWGGAIVTAMTKIDRSYKGFDNGRPAVFTILVYNNLKANECMYSFIFFQNPMLGLFSTKGMMFLSIKTFSPQLYLYIHYSFCGSV